MVLDAVAGSGVWILELGVGRDWASFNKVLKLIMHHL